MARGRLVIPIAMLFVLSASTVLEASALKACPAAYRKTLPFFRIYSGLVSWLPQIGAEGMIVERYPEEAALIAAEIRSSNVNATVRAMYSDIKSGHLAPDAAVQKMETIYRENLRKILAIRQTLQLRNEISEPRYRVFDQSLAKAAAQLAVTQNLETEFDVQAIPVVQTFWRNDTESMRHGETPSPALLHKFRGLGLSIESLWAEQLAAVVLPGVRHLGLRATELQANGIIRGNAPLGRGVMNPEFDIVARNRGMVTVYEVKTSVDVLDHERAMQSGLYDQLARQQDLLKYFASAKLVLIVYGTVTQDIKNQLAEVGIEVWSQGFVMN